SGRTCRPRADHSSTENPQYVFRPRGPIMPLDPSIFQPVLQALERGFRQLEIKVPPPVRKPWRDSFVFRYAEQTIQQAIVQKLARMISGLHAIKVLMEH